MPDERFSYSALLRDSVRLYGSWGTVRRLTGGFWEFLRDSLPARRRLRFGDLDFDFERHTDTTWSNVPTRTRFREIFAGRGYQPTDPVIFCEMMEHVSGDLSSFNFIDLGCGKGRALLLARDYLFRRIVGVELLPELLASARRNVERLPAEEQPRFQFHCADARSYKFPPEPTFLYLFDPFPALVLREVLTNLARSIHNIPRPVWVGYQNPVSEHVLESSLVFKKVGGTKQWALYRKDA